jgi:hypothetical protein
MSQFRIWIADRGRSPLSRGDLIAEREHFHA